MGLPTKEEAKKILNNYVKNEYQRFHAKMVAVAMEGYAEIFGENINLWYVAGLLHDLDFEEYPEIHPVKELEWFREWNYPREFIHAIEAHAYGYNNFKILPESKLAFTLLACDEISGIFYAYKKINPIPYRDMKVKSIKKRLAEGAFAAKIDREVIKKGVGGLGIEMEEHIQNLINFFSVLD